MGLHQKEEWILFIVNAWKHHEARMEVVGYLPNVITVYVLLNTGF